MAHVRLNTFSDPPNFDVLVVDAVVIDGRPVAFVNLIVIILRIGLNQFALLSLDRFPASLEK